MKLNQWCTIDHYPGLRVEVAGRHGAWFGKEPPKFYLNELGA